MTTTTKQKELRTPVTKLSMEDKSQESNTASTNKTTGSRRAASPGSSKPAAARQLEDIWKKDSASGSPERRRNGISSSQFIELWLIHRKQDLVATMMLMTADWVTASREPDSSVGDRA